MGPVGTGDWVLDLGLTTRLYSQDMRHGDKESCDGILLQTFVIHSGHWPGLLGLLTVPRVDLSLLLKSENKLKNQEYIFGSDCVIPNAIYS